MATCVGHQTWELNEKVHNDCYCSDMVVLESARNTNFDVRKRFLASGMGPIEEEEELLDLIDYRPTENPSRNANWTESLVTYVPPSSNKVKSSSSKRGKSSRKLKRNRKEAARSQSHGGHHGIMLDLGTIDETAIIVRSESGSKGTLCTDEDMVSARLAEMKKCRKGRSHKDRRRRKKKSKARRSNSHHCDNMLVLRSPRDTSPPLMLENTSHAVSLTARNNSSSRFKPTGTELMLRSDSTSTSGRSGRSLYDENTGHGRYIDQFLPTISKYPVLMPLFDSSRDATITFAALRAVKQCSTLDHSFDPSRQSLKSSFTQSRNRVLCIVVGDGRYPRTALTAAVKFGWTVVSVDEHLDEEWEGHCDSLNIDGPNVCNYLGFYGTLEDFLDCGNEDISESIGIFTDDIQHLIIIGFQLFDNHEPLRLSGPYDICDIRAIFNNSLTTVVSISPDIEPMSIPVHEEIRCSLAKDLGYAPNYSYIDDGIFSQSRLVQVWNFHDDVLYPSVKNESNGSEQPDFSKKRRSTALLPPSDDESLKKEKTKRKSRKSKKDPKAPRKNSSSKRRDQKKVCPSEYPGKLSSKSLSSKKKMSKSPSLRSRPSNGSDSSSTFRMAFQMNKNGKGRRSDDATASTAQTSSLSSVSLSTTNAEFHKGDIVEVKIGDTYQVGVIENESIKGLYDVVMYSDTPAWREKRRKFSLYNRFHHKYGMMPEVRSKQMRSFRLATPGETLYILENDIPKKCRVVHVVSDGVTKTSISEAIYIVQYAHKSGKGWENKEYGIRASDAYRRQDYT